MAEIERKQLPTASSVKLNQVVRCLHGPLKYLHSWCAFTVSRLPPGVTASELALVIFRIKLDVQINLRGVVVQILLMSNLPGMSDKLRRQNCQCQEAFRWRVLQF